MDESSSDSENESSLSEHEEEERRAIDDSPSKEEFGTVTGIRVLFNSKFRHRKEWTNKSKENSAIVKRIRKGPALASSKEKLNSHTGLVEYGIRKTLDMVVGGSIRTVTIMDASESLDNSLPLPPDFDKNKIVDLFRKSWAKRPPRGQMYGPKYIERFRNEIYEMYEAGNKEKSEKKSPGQMLEILNERYPLEFCLPSENDIRSEISKFQVQRKKGPAPSTLATKPSEAGGRTNSSQKDLTTFLHQLLAINPAMKPAEALSHVKSKFDASKSQLPSDQQIKSKFSALKTKEKKK